MKLRALLLAVFLCLFTFNAYANTPIMPIKDLKPGMQGVGKTVINGDTIEEFNVEILGVNGSETSGYSIFVRLYGDLIDKTKGVAQGMSGSPVYVDGRLVGAVAFGKAFNDPHYCFLTPISNMLRLLDEPVNNNSDLIPKGTALLAGGFTPSGMEYLKDKLAEVGMEAIDAGGANANVSSKPLEPGSAIGVSLMQGDLSLGALGTVTWTDDENNVLAFGHPFMQRGASNFFMNKVWVLGCIPNLQSSYKVGTIGQPIGTINQDRASGIGGKIGKLPHTIPVYAVASDLDRGFNNTIRVNVIEDEKMLPAIVDSAVVNNVSKAMDRNGGGTAKVSFEITGKDSNNNYVTINRDNMFYATENLQKIINIELAEAMKILTQNKFEKVDIYGINVNTEITEDVQVAEIVRVGTKKREVKAGETVPIDVTLKPYRGQEYTKTIEFKVPEKYASGKMALSVRGGSSLAWVQNLLRKQQEEGMPAPKKEKRHKLADFIKKLNNSDRNNEIIVDISASPNMNFKPENPPKEDAGFEGMLEGSPYKQKTACDYIIDGESEIVINVTK